MTHIICYIYKYKYFLNLNVSGELLTKPQSFITQIDGRPNCTVSEDCRLFKDKLIKFISFNEIILNLKAINHCT